MRKVLQLFIFLSLSIFPLTQMSSQIPAPNAPRLSSIVEIVDYSSITTGADQIDDWVIALKDLKVGVLVNTTSILNDRTHLVDALLERGVEVKKIFAPEHGFRASADAGEKVEDSVDSETGIPIISLYGNHQKPTERDLEGIDLVIFDIQDVGLRFYTYISSLEYLMQACNEYGKTLLVLDRPNPNGFYVAGPILDNKFQSFVGRQAIPVVHGLTVGEYALMLQGENWVASDNSHLGVIACKNYKRMTTFDLPVKPSPNLPTHRSVLLYPSLCLFEGTEVSIGRGTATPFELYGHPDFKDMNFTFTPQSMPGAKHPKLQGKECHGFSFSDMSIEDILDHYTFSVELLHSAFAKWKSNQSFFLKNNFIDKLAGTDQLRKDIVAGKSTQKIESKWQAALEEYMEMRKEYLLYQ